MTNRFPLIVNPDTKEIQELKSNDNLDLTGNGIYAGGSLGLNGQILVTNGNTIEWRTISAVGGGGGSGGLDLNTTYTVETQEQIYGASLNLVAGGTGIGTIRIKFLDNSIFQFDTPDNLSISPSIKAGSITNSCLQNNSFNVTIGSIPQQVSLGGSFTIPTYGDVFTTATQTISNKTLSSCTISGATNTLSSIPNTALINSSITINNTAVALGGSINITGGGGLDTDTTYTIAAVNGNAANKQAIRLTGSNTLTDDVVFVAGPRISLSRIGDEITITGTEINTDTNTDTTYSVSADTLVISGQSAGARLNLVGGGSGVGNGITDRINFKNGNGVTISSPNVDDITISISQDISTSSNVTFNNLNLTGNLTVAGALTYINTTNLTVTDKTITIADGVTNSLLADGSGILLGTSNINLVYSNASLAWESTSNLNLVTSKTYKIGGTTVLSSTQVLGKSIPTGNLVGTTDSQTISNKTLVNVSASSIINTGTVYFPAPTISDTLIGRNTSDILTNKIINGNNNTITGIGNNSLTYDSIIINGTSVMLGGSINVTSSDSYTDEKAQDAIAASFTTGSHTGISYVYDDTTGRINSTVNTTGNVYASVANFPGANLSTGTLAYATSTGSLYYSNAVSWTSQRIVTTNSSTSSDFATLLGNTQLTYSTSVVDVTSGNTAFNLARKILRLSNNLGTTSDVTVVAGAGLSIARIDNALTITNDLAFTYGISAETATGSNTTLRLGRTDSTNDDILLVGAGGLTVERTDASTITFRAPPTVVTQYTDALAKDAVYLALNNGTKVGISYTYDSVNKVINSLVSGGGGGSGEVLTYDLQGRSTTSNNAFVDLIPSTGTTDSIEFTSSGGSSVAWDNANKRITISSVAPVSADWNAVSGLAQIQNKPTIPSAYTLPTATGSVLGGIKVGANLSINATTGVLDANTGSYTLPTATGSVLGGIKLGSGLSIDGNGVVSSSGGNALLPSIQTVSGTTASLATDAYTELNIVGHETYTIYKINASKESWIRIYTDDVSRDADITRSEGQDPLSGSGLIAEIRTANDNDTVLITPGVLGFNNDSLITNIIYLSVTNRSVSLTPITVTLTILGGSGITNTGGSSGSSYTLPTATTSILGGIKVGANLSMDSVTGILSANTGSYTLPTASVNTLGGVKVDNTTITITSGVISTTPYSLPTATTTVLGGILIGSGLSITNGVVSVASTAQVNSDWNAVSGLAQILNKPTLFSGSYIDLTNKPTLFSGSYIDLTNKPTLFSGSYIDLTNKPTIPAGQVNSDWNAVSGLAQIQNKPTIPSAYTLPTASASVIGGIKVGANLSINATTGVLDANTGSYTQSGTGAVERTIQSKLNDIVSVKDFGATGDGITDDTTSIQNAINYIQNANGGIVNFPPGIYKISSTLQISKSNTKLFGFGSDFPNAPDPNTPNKASCSIRWYGNYGGTMISIITPPGANNRKISCCGITGIELVGNGGGNNTAAAIGLYMKSIFKCDFEHLNVKNVTNVCYFLTAWYRSDTPNRPNDSYLAEFPDSQHNIFNQCDFDCTQHSAFYSCHGFRLTSDPLTDKPSNTLEATVLPRGNSSINEFHLCDGMMQGNSTSGYGFWLEDADNNSFYTCRVYRVSPHATPQTTSWANTKPSVYVNGRVSDANHFHNYTDGSAYVDQNNLNTIGTYQGQSIYIATGPGGNAYRCTFYALDTSNGVQIPYCEPGTGIDGFKNTPRVITDQGQLYNYNSPRFFGCNFANPTSPLHVGNEMMIEGSGDTPRFKFKNNYDSINNKVWQWTVFNQEMYLQPLNDSGVGGGNLFKFTRSGAETVSFLGTNSGTTWFNANNTTQTLTINNAVITTSDSREKIEINNSILGIDFIKSLRPVSYKFKIKERKPILEKDENGNVILDDNGNSTYVRDKNNEIIYESFPGLRSHYGFIAQEVKQSVDNAGVDFAGWVIEDLENPESKQGLRYEELIAPLTKALQEALIKIETLEQKVLVLENII